MDKVKEYAIKIRGIIDPSVRSAMENANRLFSSLQSKQKAYNEANRRANEIRPYLKTLQGIQKEIEGYTKAKEKLGELQSKIRESQSNLQQLTSQRIQSLNQQQQLMQKQNALKNKITEQTTNAERKELETTIRRIQQEYNMKAREIQKLDRQINTQSNTQTTNQATYQRQVESLRRLTESLRQAGVDVQNLAQSETRLHNEIERTTNQLNQQTARQTRLNQSQQHFDQSSSNVSSKYSNFQSSIDTANTILNPMKEMVMVQAGYEKEMSKVKAITHANEEEFARLNDKAREIGRTTQFKASEAAEAEKYMAMAGWNIEQIIPAMKPLTNLAAASDVSISRASDVITDLMTAFRIDTTKEENITRFVDQAVMVQQKANTDLEGVYQAMKFAAPVMQTIGMTTEESFAFLGSMANAGIKDTNAGTALRAIGLRIGGSAKNAKKAADEMGISLSDAQMQQMESQYEVQNLVGAAKAKELYSIEDEGTRVYEIMRAISEAFKGMSEAEQVSSAGRLFGTPATSGGLAVLKDFQAGELDKLRGYLKNSDGVADETARVMNDNLLGDIMRYESALESLSMTYTRTFYPVTRQAYQTVTNYVSQLEEWINTHQELARGIATVAAGISGIMVAGAGLSLAFSGLQYISSGIGLIATKISLLPNIFTTVTAVIRGAFLSLAGLSLPVLAGILALAGAAYLIYDNWAIVSPLFEDAFSTIQNMFNEIVPIVYYAYKTMASGWDMMSSKMSEIDFSSITNALEQIALVAGGFFAGLAVAITGIIAMFAELGAAIMNIMGVAFRAIAMMIEGDFEGAWNLACERVEKIVDELIKQIEGTFDAAFETISGIVDKVGSAISNIGSVKAEVQSTLGISTSATTTEGTSIEKVEATTAEIQQANIPTEAVQNTGMQEVANTIQNVDSAVQSSTSSLQNLDQSVLNTATATVPQVDATVQTVVPQIQQLGQTAQDSSAGFAGLIASANEAASALSNLASAVSSAVSGIQSAAASASANISATIATIPVAHNAVGGIYPRGEFLTTFAEDSAEAAIPLDGSSRAISLWQRAGQILGVYPSSLINAPDTGLIDHATNSFSSVSNSHSVNPSVNISFTINGNADRDIMNQAAESIIEGIQQTFEEQYMAMMHERSRVAFT